MQTDGIRNTGEEKPRMRTTQEADVHEAPASLRKPCSSFPALGNPKLQAPVQTTRADNVHPLIRRSDLGEG